MTAHGEFKPDSEPVVLMHGGFYGPTLTQELLRNPSAAAGPPRLHSIGTFRDGIAFPTQSGRSQSPRALVDVLDQVLDLTNEMVDEILADWNEDRNGSGIISASWMARND